MVRHQHQQREKDKLLVAKLQLSSSRYSRQPEAQLNQVAVPELKPLLLQLVHNLAGGRPAEIITNQLGYIIIYCLQTTKACHQTKPHRHHNFLFEFVDWGGIRMQ